MRTFFNKTNNISRALIGNSSHHFLFIQTSHPEKGLSWNLPTLTFGERERPLALWNQWFQEQTGVALPGPCGQFPRETTSPFHFTFILPPSFRNKTGEAWPTPWQWVSLAKVPQWMAERGEKEAITEFWAQYDQTLLGGYHPPTRTFDVIYFGNSPELAAKLAHLVVKGQKRGTAGVYETTLATQQIIPYPGLLTLVTDGFGIPLCFIETVKVLRVPFKEIPAGFPLMEGEGDMSMEDWKEGHTDYFIQEARDLGLTFTEDSEVFLEEFKVVKVLGT